LRKRGPDKQEMRLVTDEYPMHHLAD
jgi:hypothetical protein